MKTLIKYIFPLLLFVTENSVAQNKFSYGSRIAMSIMPAEKNDATGTNFKLGLNGGIFLNYQFSNRFSLRPELNYHLKKQIQTDFDTTDILNTIIDLVGIGGGGIDLPDGINLNGYSTTKNLQRLHYIELPVLVTAHLSHVKISAGPYVGFLAAANTRSTTTLDIPALSLIDIESLLGNQGGFVDFILNSAFPGYSEPVEDIVKSTSDFNRIDVGAVVDISYQLENNFNFGLRYQQGFINYSSLANNEKTLLRSLQFAIGYRLGKGKAEGPIRKPYDYNSN